MSVPNNTKQGRIAKFFADFRAFISKGNILDMAVGVIIGGAFGKIVTSLVNDIIMPLITLAVGGKSVDDWKWVITAATEESAESAVYYGRFFQSILDFLIIAFFIFIALRIIINLKVRLKKEEEGAVLLTKPQRKALKKQLKADGHSNKEIIAMIEQKENDLTAAQAQAEAKAEEESRAKAEAEQTINKSHTEILLEEIRDLLKSQKIQ